MGDDRSVSVDIRANKRTTLGLVCNCHGDQLASTWTHRPAFRSLVALAMHRLSIATAFSGKKPHSSVVLAPFPFPAAVKEAARFWCSRAFVSRFIDIICILTSLKAVLTIGATKSDGRGVFNAGWSVARLIIARTNQEKAAATDWCDMKRLGHSSESAHLADPGPACALVDREISDAGTPATSLGRFN